MEVFGLCRALTTLNKTKKVYLGDHAIRNCGPILWNSLDKTIKQCKSTKTFKYKLKSNLLSKYDWFFRAWCLCLPYWSFDHVLNIMCVFILLFDVPYNIEIKFDMKLDFSYPCTFLPFHTRFTTNISNIPLILLNNPTLTGGNWQKWKRVFLTCPCHEIYRDEAVGLKGCKNTWKITIFVKMWNLGQYRENLIFCQ